MKIPQILTLIPYQSILSVYYSVYLFAFNVRYTYLVNNSLFISILHLDLLLLEI